MFSKKDPYPFNFILIYIVIKLLLLLTKLNIYAIWNAFETYFLKGFIKYISFKFKRIKHKINQ